MNHHSPFVKLFFLSYFFGILSLKPNSSHFIETLMTLSFCHAQDGQPIGIMPIMMTVIFYFGF